MSALLKIKPRIISILLSKFIFYSNIYTPQICSIKLVVLNSNNRLGFKNWLLLYLSLILWFFIKYVKIPSDALSKKIVVIIVDISLKKFYFFWSWFLYTFLPQTDNYFTKLTKKIYSKKIVNLTIGCNFQFPFLYEFDVFLDIYDLSFFWKIQVYISVFNITYNRTVYLNFIHLTKIPYII